MTDRTSYADITVDTYASAIAEYAKAHKSGEAFASAHHAAKGKANERLARTSTFISIAQSFESICDLLRNA